MDERDAVPPSEVDGFGEVGALVAEAEALLRVALLEGCLGEDVERHRLVAAASVPAVQFEGVACEADCALDVAFVKGGECDPVHEVGGLRFVSERRGDLGGVFVFRRCEIAAPCHVVGRAAHAQRERKKAWLDVVPGGVEKPVNPLTAC